MPRVQAEYQQRVAAPQAEGAVMIQPTQFAANPNASSAFQLAHALGVADTRPLMAGLADQAKIKKDEEEAAARAYGNSMTTDELGRKIKAGEMLPSQSPAYVATVQHLYGENSMSQIENKLSSDLTTGTLKLNSPQEVDQYLTKARNDHLSGQSAYTVAGFDKGWNRLRESMITANTRMQDKEYTQHAVETSTETLTNLVTKDATGSVEEQAGNFMGTYQMLRDGGVLLTPEASKEALRSSLGAAAATGNKALVDTILASKLDNGQSVSTVIGPEQGLAISNRADQENRQRANQRLDVELRPLFIDADKGLLDVKKLDQLFANNEEFLTTPTYMQLINTNERALDQLRKGNEGAFLASQVMQSDADARRAIAASLSTRTFSRLPQQKVLNKRGETEDAKQVELAQEILEQSTQGMPVEERLAVYSANNVPDEALKTRLLGGLSNLATVGWKYDGKNIGEVSPVGTAAFEEFIKANKVNPEYVSGLVGEKAYKNLSLIEFMNVKGGSGGIKEAARVVNEANNSGITQADFDKNYKSSVNAAVNNIYNPAWYSKTGSWFSSFFGNETPNLTVIHSLVRTHSELLVRSGIEPSTAVETSMKYLADPARSTKINNVLYPNSALPTVPQGEDIKVWMERYKKEIPQKVSDDLKVNGENIVLMPQSTGNFIAMNGGLPVQDKDGHTLEFSKEDFSKWVDTSMKADKYKQVGDKNFALFQARIEAEMIKSMPRDSLPGAGQGARSTALNTIGSRESYDRYLKEGMADKPVSELQKKHREWNPLKGWQPFSK